MEFNGAARSQGQSALFRLPRELRLLILYEVFRGSRIAIVDSSTSPGQRIVALAPATLHSALELSLLCRLIYPEVVKAFYDMTDLGLSHSQNIDQVERLLTNLYPRVDLTFGNTPSTSFTCHASHTPRAQAKLKATIKYLASCRRLRSVAVHVPVADPFRVQPNDGGRNMYNDDLFDHAVSLERTLQSHLQELTTAKRVCLWVAWPKGMDLRPLPDHFRVHRVLYIFEGFSNMMTGSKFKVVDEGPDGKELQVRESSAGPRVACAYCNDLFWPTRKSAKRS